MKMRGLGWGWLVLSCMSGCATSSGSSTPVAQPAPIEQKRPSEPAAAAAAPVPSCPEDIALEPALEDKDYPGREAGTWHADLSRITPDRSQSLPLGFQQRLALASGPLEVTGHYFALKDGQKAGSALVTLARPHEGGYCIVNSWVLGALQGAVTLADTWTAHDGKHAIILLKVTPDEKSPEPGNRWVVVGTDGRRAWVALGTPPQHHLLVPAVKLFPYGKDLYLDIQQRYVTRLRLGPDGRFIVPTPAQ